MLFLLKFQNIFGLVKLSNLFNRTFYEPGMSRTTLKVNIEGVL